MELLNLILKFFKSIVRICLDFYKSLNNSNNYKKLSFMKDDKILVDVSKTRGWGFQNSSLVCKKDDNDRFYMTMEGDRYELSKRRMYKFPPFIDHTLGISIDFDKDIKKNLLVAPPSQINVESELFRRLNVLSETVLDNEIRISCSHGQTGTEQWQLLYGGESKSKLYDAVIYPKSEQEVSQIVVYIKSFNKLATQMGEKTVTITTVGGKTNVCWALKIDKESEKIHIAIDMTKYMNKIIWVDDINNMVCVSAGIRGVDLEQALQKHGKTVGHEPDSMEFSTVGGWAATRASGMKKNAYGNIEDIILGLVGVNGCGDIFNSGIYDKENAKSLHDQYNYFSRVSHGPSLVQCLLGNEGNSAIFTRVIMKCVPIENLIKEYDAMLVHNLDDALKIGKDLMDNKQAMPVSVRFVDYTQYCFGAALNPEPENMIASITSDLQKQIVQKYYKFDEQMLVATITYEGTNEIVNNQKKLIKNLSKKYNCLRMGAEHGKRGYLLTFAIAYIRDFMTNIQIIGETFESSVPWSNVKLTTERVKERLILEHSNMRETYSDLPESQPFLSWRLTQFYECSVVIYFMFGYYCGDSQYAIESFEHIEHALRDELIKCGGSISHHHGIGKLRRNFIEKHMDPATINMLKQIRSSMDPDKLLDNNNTFSI